MWESWVILLYTMYIIISYWIWSKLCLYFQEDSESIEKCCSEAFLSTHVVSVVRDMILPNCVWRAGRTSAAVRLTAVTCLWTLLKNEILNQENVWIFVLYKLCNSVNNVFNHISSKHYIQIFVKSETYTWMMMSIDQIWNYYFCSKYSNIYE